MQQKTKARVRRQIAIFCAIAVLGSWLLWLPALLERRGVLTLPVSADLFLRLGSFVPAVAGILLAFLAGGRAAGLSLLRSMVKMPLTIRWLLFALLFLPAVSAVSCLLVVLLGGVLLEMSFPTWFIPVAFVYIFVLMGPLGEEAGWRGYALPRLLAGMRPFTAALLLGAIWSLWHLPLFFIGGTTQNMLSAFGLAPALLCYLLYTVMISILLTLLYVKTGGSILGAMLLHATANLSLGVVPLIFSKTGAAILLFVLLAATAVMGVLHRKTLFKKPENKF